VNAEMEKAYSPCMPLTVFTIEVEYRKSEKAQILRFLGMWQFLLICGIPLLSAPNWHTKAKKPECLVDWEII
jgi:hypothetical protein